MEIYPFEIVNFLLENTALNSSDKEKLQIYPKKIEFRLLDCRIKKGSYVLPFTIELPDNAYRSKEALTNSLVEIFKAHDTTHICIIKSHNPDDAEKEFLDSVLKQFKELHKNYISIVLGGNEVCFPDLYELLIQF